jgi:hypothetical protein
LPEGTSDCVVPFNVYDTLLSKQRKGSESGSKAVHELIQPLSNVAFAGSCWRFMEDVRNKPGWVFGGRKTVKFEDKNKKDVWQCDGGGQDRRLTFRVLCNEKVCVVSLFFFP